MASQQKVEWWVPFLCCTLYVTVVSAGLIGVAKFLAVLFFSN